MGETRVEAQVIGAGSPGHLKVRLGARDREVAVDLLPLALRTPNSTFVAVVEGGDFLRVETAGRAWLELQDRMRIVLNTNWDPIGVASEVADEYDSYIGGLYSLLRQDASADELAAHLLRIETDSMGLSGSSKAHRLGVARRLLALDLPSP